MPIYHVHDLMKKHRPIWGLVWSEDSRVRACPIESLCGIPQWELGLLGLLAEQAVPERAGAMAPASKDSATVHPQDAHAQTFIMPSDIAAV